MKKSLALLALALAALVAGAAFVAAQEPVVGSPDPESLFTSKDPKLNTNKQAAMHIMRDLLEAGHWSEAPMWLTEKYLQHNPAIASGRDNVMKFFGGLSNKEVAETLGVTERTVERHWAYAKAWLFRNIKSQA